MESQKSVNEGSDAKTPESESAPVQRLVRQADVPRRQDIGFGVHVTEGVDGVFVHFKYPSGRSMGFCVDESSSVALLGLGTMHEWAKAILDGHDSLRALE